MSRAVMKAIHQTEFGGSATLYNGETDKPILKSNEILIEVHYAGLNRADILQREGKYPPPKGDSTILGLEASGKIAEVGKGVTDFFIGDRVMALLAGGGQAEYVAVDSRLVWKIPPELSLEQAAAIPEVFLTAFQALFFEGKAIEKSSVLIHAGGSGVGTAAIQLAKAEGCKVITTSSVGKLAICKKLGADFTIDYQSQNFEDEVKEITNAKGVETILDFIGAPYFKKNLNCLATDGSLIIISVMGGVKLENLNLYPILSKRLTVKGTTLRSRSIGYKQKLIGQFLQKFWSQFRSGNITPVIDTVFNWTDIKRAHDFMEANKNKGKIVLKIKS